MINNSKLKSKILVPFLSSSDNLLKDMYIIFQKGADDFSIAHKHANYQFGVHFPLHHAC